MWFLGEILCFIYVAAQQTVQYPLLANYAIFTIKSKMKEIIPSTLKPTNIFAEQVLEMKDPIIGKH